VWAVANGALNCQLLNNVALAYLKWLSQDGQQEEFVNDNLSKDTTFSHAEPDCQYLPRDGFFLKGLNI
jgi:hypothetical protein